MRNFIGTSRWQQLATALREAAARPQIPPLSTAKIGIALLISLTPVLVSVLEVWSHSPPTTIPTIAFGVCAVLAVLHRKWCKLPFHMDRAWLKQLSLTHTAVALGCIPAVVVIFVSPELLAARHDILSAQLQPGAGGAMGPRVKPNILLLISYLGFIASWVAVTEELIFRGLLVSVLRRWDRIPLQWQRDVFAGVVSALIFGLAHFTHWGPAAAIALVGLGVGFVIAYIANGERLIPVILYHFAFDVLSISLAVFG